MAFESMSSSRADNKFERMLHEVHSQRGRAPTTGLPRSAREDEEETVDFTSNVAASARVAAPAISAREGEVVDDKATVRNILDAIEAVGGNLYKLTTPEERANVRRATCPPRATLERTMQTNPTSSLLTTSLLAVGAGVLLGSLLSSRADGYRGVAAASSSKPSSLSARAVERMLEYA